MTTNAQPNITSVGNLTGVTVTGTSTLGNIGNVKITGGSNAQVIQTDGAGNLSFASIAAASYQLKPVRAATVSSITLSGTQTVDGVSLIVGDRVLVWFQNSNVITGDVTNGIYVVQSGSWTRAADFNTGAETLSGGVSVIASEGTNQKGVVFSCNNTGTITVGSTNITFVRNINQSGFISISTNTLATNQRPASVGNVSGAIAIGVAANSSADGVSIGYESYVTGGGSVGIGYQAKTRDFSVSIGREAGVTDQDRQVNVGRQAGRYNQGTDITAIGHGALGTYFTPAGATAVGADSGIAGINSVAIGREAGRISSGGGATHSIAIGYQSAYQIGNANVIAIGSTASYNAPRQESIAIGREAGYANIGEDSIAIGSFAGRTNQANNTIILNATGANLNQTTANTFTVKPVREINNLSSSVLDYNTTTGEISSHLRTFGSFTSNATQTSNGANTTNYMTLNNTEDANGISIASSTQLTVARVGRYNIQFSAQVEKTDAGSDLVEIWLDKNGTAVANSATQITLRGSNAKEVAAWDFNVNAANVNDYFRLAWASPDTDVRLTAIAAANTISGVALPSVIVNINPIGA